MNDKRNNNLQAKPKASEEVEQELQQLSAYHHLEKKKQGKGSIEQTKSHTKRGTYYPIYLCAGMRNWGGGELSVLEKMDVLLRQRMLHPVAISLVARNQYIHFTGFSRSNRSAQ